MVNYGEKCNRDSDCASKICELSFGDGGVPERRCIIQETTFGPPCELNSQCDSNRCVDTFDGDGNFKGRRCKVIIGQVIPERREFDDTDEDDLPAHMRTPEAKAIRNKEMLISNKQKRFKFQGRGPLTDFIVLVLELIIELWKIVLKIIFGVFKMFLRLWSLIFGSILSGKGWFSFSKNHQDRKTGKCKDYATTIRKESILLFYTFIFPPLGVFMDRGVIGFGHVVATMLFTSMFYFPGLTYALTIINNNVCPTSIELFSGRNFRGQRLKLNFGDYNDYDESTSSKFYDSIGQFDSADDFAEQDAVGESQGSPFEVLHMCYSDEGKSVGGGVTLQNIFIQDKSMLIDSVRIGKKVKLILYQERNYITDGVVGKPMIVLEDNVSNILKKIEALNNPNYTKDCRSQSGYNNPGNSPKVGSMSIVLKQPKPLVPSRIDDDEVVLYLLNDFRGQYLRLKEGDFDSDELTSLFSGRISSIRMGKNMKIKIYENSNYNYVSFANFSTGATAELISPSLAANNEYFTSTGGWEKELYGNVTHNQDREDKTYKQGEIPFLAAVEGVAEGIRSIMVRPLDKDFTDFKSNSDVWNDSAFTRTAITTGNKTDDFFTQRGNETDDFFTQKGNETDDLFTQKSNETDEAFTEDIPDAFD